MSAEVNTSALGLAAARVRTSLGAKSPRAIAPWLVG